MTYPVAGSVGATRVVDISEATATTVVATEFHARAKMPSPALSTSHGPAAAQCPSRTNASANVAARVTVPVLGVAAPTFTGRCTLRVEKYQPEAMSVTGVITAR